MRLLGRYRGFAGGIHLGDGRPQTLRRSVADLPIPAVLRVPLAQFDEPPADAGVRGGDRVAAGEVIAAAHAGRPATVHAPVDADVAGFVAVDTPYCRDVPAVELKTVPGSTLPSETDVELPACSFADLSVTLHGAGIDQLDLGRGPGTPRVDWIIINALESHPLHTADLRCLIEHTDEAIATAAWLCRVAGARHVALAVDARRGRLPAGGAVLRRAARGTPVRVVALPNKYPRSSGVLLTRAVTGREVPYRAGPIDVGVWVVDVCALLAVRLAVGAGRPQTHTVMTVAGDPVENPGDYRVPLGVTVDDLARHVGVASSAPRVIADNPLCGPAVGGGRTVLTKRTRSLIFTTAPSPADRPPLGCIRCGSCQDHCPVGLDPRALLDLVERRRFEAVATRYPAACIDCGLCSYVCPSSLPLMRAVQRSRRHVAAV